MIDRILALYGQSTYDFRAQANPADPLAHLFADWVPYYRMKAAIAAALAPQRILEIGVRFGYGGAAFLHGAPTAHYTGIDIDSDSFGGVRGAMDWARRILPAGQHELVVANTQHLAELPGGRFDLIHVDGQQDGDSTFHDLELAIAQADWVLLDGYLWTPQNFRAASEFLLHHRDRLDYYFVIPGYAGELLIKTRGVARTDAGEQAAHSSVIRDTYNADYYLKDCGGWDAFQVHRGRLLTDLRLRSVFDLAMLRPVSRTLDLGCGRGEIAYQAAVQESEVVAVDYSADAIAIARESIAAAPPALRERIELRCEDASTTWLRAPADVAIAGDLVEHMAPAELDRLYAQVASQLAPAGRFLVHTFPNKWFYDYDYVARRRAAAAVGAYLPPDPRSRYERLMHINEQSPRVLRRQLARHFRHVLLWFSTPEDPAGSLRRRCRPRELAAFRDIFAFASHQPIDPAEIVALFQPHVWTPHEIGQLELQLAAPPTEMPAGASQTVSLRVNNRAPIALNSFGAHPIHLAYHWVRADGIMHTFDGRRSPIVPSIAAGQRRVLQAMVVAPSEPGDYQLEVSLVQEGVNWFHQVAPTALVSCRVRILPTA
jgi:SAM-dependent methyltransferase